MIWNWILKHVPVKLYKLFVVVIEEDFINLNIIAHRNEQIYVILSTCSYCIKIKHRQKKAL